MLIKTHYNNQIIEGSLNVVLKKLPQLQKLSDIKQQRHWLENEHSAWCSDALKLLYSFYYRLDNWPGPHDIYITPNNSGIISVVRDGFDSIVDIRSASFKQNSYSFSKAFIELINDLLDNHENPVTITYKGTDTDRLVDRTTKRFWPHTYVHPDLFNDLSINVWEICK